MKRKIFLLFILMLAGVIMMSSLMAATVDQNGVDMLMGAKNALQLYKQYGDTSGVSSVISKLELFLSKYTEPAQYVGQAYELLGDAYYLLGKYDQAIKEYKKSLTYLPKSSTDYEYTVYSLGYSYMNMGDYSNAISYFLSLYTSPKYADEARVLVGSVYVKTGKYSQAKKVLSEVHANVWKAWANFYLGKIAFNTKDFKTAHKLFTSVSNYSNDPNVLEPAAYYDAYSLLNMNEIQEAMKTASDAIKSYPPTVWSADLYTILGESYYRNGQYSQALIAFEKAVQLAPENSKLYKALNAKAWTEYKLGKYEDAISDWESVLQKAMDTNLRLSAGLSAGATYREQKEYDNALKLYKKMEPIFTSQKNQIILQEGKTYLEKGDYTKAVSIFEKLASIVDPVSDSAAYWLGYTYNIQGKYDDAIKVLNKLIASTKDTNMKAKAYMLKGDIYFGKSNYKDAESSYENAVALGTNETKNVAEYNLGLIYYNANEYSKSLSYLKDVMSKRTLDPDLALNAAYYLSQSYMNLKDYTSALETYDWIIKYDFEGRYTSSVYVLKAVAMEKLGEYSKVPSYVDSVLNRVATLSTRNDLLFHKAYAYLMTKDLKDAHSIATSLLKARMSTDAMGGILYIEAKYYQSVNDVENAAKYFKEVYTNYPSSSSAPNAAYELGMMYYRIGKYSSAKDAFFNLVSLFGSDSRVPEAFYYIGMSYENLGQISAAVQVYHTILTKFPNSGAASLARKRLSALGKR
jgi:tetratricopeptide (TPR) repeat protein